MVGKGEEARERAGNRGGWPPRPRGESAFRRQRWGKGRESNNCADTAERPRVMRTEEGTPRCGWGATHDSSRKSCVRIGVGRWMGVGQIGSGKVEREVWFYMGIKKYACRG